VAPTAQDRLKSAIPAERNSGRAQFGPRPAIRVNAGDAIHASLAMIRIAITAAFDGLARET
jgi:hypothetical protein